MSRQLSSVRSFSDRAMGYSPMAPGAYNPQILNPDSKEIPSAKDVEIAGGIWGLSSSKKEKLAELKVEAMANEIGTLDDAATAEQKLDLWLVDGLAVICKHADTHRVDSSEGAHESKAFLHQVVEHCNKKAAQENELTQVQWDEYLADVQQHIDTALAKIPADRCFRDVRDYFDPSTEKLDDDDKALLNKFDAKQEKFNEKTNTQFDYALVRFRLLQTREAVKNLRDAWKTVTTVTDQEMDRAAVKGETLDTLKTLPVGKLNTILESYLIGNCQDRLEALWNFFDKDNDGLLDDVEMNNACNMAVDPVGQAVLVVLEEALEAYPVRAPMPSLELDSREGKILSPHPMGWRQKRREKKEKKRLLKLFRKTLKNHFQNEVELSHRLRCSYAWANKSHQNNRLDSVMVEEKGWSGRQRYVELKPKIALVEFREVQAIHIAHLDRVSSEYIKSFREDLLLQQGKGRQNKELIRDCMLFLAGVCTVDFIILSI